MAKRETPLTNPDALRHRSEPSSIGRGWPWLKTRLRDRDDSEHEQILIRIVLGSIALAYVVFGVNLANEPGYHGWLGLAIVSGHFLGAWALLAHLLAAPSANPLRRSVGMVLDIVALTAILAWGGESTALFYPLYLWVTLGMGFRYGRSYLFASAALTIAGFALVLLTTPYWQDHLPLALSLWAALLVLPAYASSLLDKLKNALERAEEANRVKGRFLATMSHELRTPLHAIIGMSKLLESKRLDHEQRHMVETVHSAGHTLLELIEDILDVARIESGRVADDVQEFDLHQVLKAVQCLLFRQARSKGLDLRMEIDPKLPYRLHGLSRRIKQILINLLGNAVKFTEKGHVVVRVGFEPIGDERILLRIDVEDTGVGIPADAIDRIFEQFVQADESTTRRHGGTGLGLAIAKQFAERMGGSLTVTSQQSEGACFSFVAPFRRSETDDERILDGAVLVIGDGDEHYESLLASWGADVVLADSWRHASHILGDGDPVRAVLLIEPSLHEYRQQFKTDIVTLSYLEPVDVVVIGGSGERADWPCLARLPHDHDTETLYRALRAALAVPVPAGSRTGAGTAKHQPRRILVAEDNRINQRVIEKMLRVGGHDVTFVSDGEDLLDKLEEDGAFDLVLADLNMPRTNGLDALKLHRIGSGDDHPPFVALTADASYESRAQCLEAGMAGYLTKPVDLHELLDVIDRVTTARPALDDHRQDGDNVVRHPRFAAQHQVLDLAHIERLRDLEQDDDFFDNIVAEFLEDARMLIGELEHAALSADGQAFRDRAHALRSSAAHMGATGISRLCLAWRDFGPSELAARGPQEMALLKAEFDRLHVALTTLTSDIEPIDVDRGPV